MPALTLVREDLLPFIPDVTEAKADAMIETVVARARRIAPCLANEDLSPDVAAAARGILRDVIIRWHEAGSGVVQQKTTQTGPYQQTETIGTERTKPRFYPNEVKELQDLCRDETTKRGKAFSVDLGQPTYGPYYVTLADGTVVDLRVRPDLWLQYGMPA